MPTDVRPGPDRYLHVSTLGGGLGEMNPQSVVCRHGNTYVAELFGGKVSVVRRGSSRTRTASTAVRPADVALDGDRLLVTTDALGEGKLASVPLGR